LNNQFIKQQIEKQFIAPMVFEAKQVTLSPKEFIYQ